jgi:ABC-type Fe3+ transport system substrate-binding protein
MVTPLRWVSKALRPNAGKAFIEFFLGEDGLKIMASIGEFVARKEIYPPLPDADKIELVEMVDMDQKASAEKMSEYRKIFLQRLGSFEVPLQLSEGWYPQPSGEE